MARLAHLNLAIALLRWRLFKSWQAKANEAAERESRAGKELDSEVSTPHEIARDMLDRHLPTTHQNGHVVPEASALKQRLLMQLDTIRMPPLGRTAGRGAAVPARVATCICS